MAKDRSRFSSSVGFLDTMFNLVIGFVFLFILSYLLINIVTVRIPPTVEREGKFVIVVQWDDGVDADVDTWVKGPDGERAGFFSRDQSAMSLLRDDLGSSNDWSTNEQGEKVLNPLNREEVSIRVPQIGRYVVNLHYFRAGGEVKEPLTVKSSLKRVKDGVILIERTQKLERQGDELTAFTFSFDKHQGLAEHETPEFPELWVTNRAGP